MPRPKSTDFSSLHPKSKSVLVIYKYWTNFNAGRARTDTYEWLTYNPETPGYWMFQTNINPEFLEAMDKSDRIQFMHKMVDYYHKEARCDL